MGYMRHHAIVVTSCIPDRIEEAHAEATRIFPWVSQISPDLMNGYRSFFIPPDGSKEGWEESEKGDCRRSMFFGWLDGKRYEDLSSPYNWACVEIRYGDDDGTVEARLNPKAEVVRDDHEHWRCRRKR